MITKEEAIQRIEQLKNKHLNWDIEYFDNDNYIDIVGGSGSDTFCFSIEFKTKGIYIAQKHLNFSSEIYKDVLFEMEALRR